MNFHPLRSRALALAVSALIAIPMFAAPKRRSAAHPTNGNLPTATVSGTVLDAVTGQPVVNAKIEAGDSFTNTTAQGSYKIANIEHHGNLTVTASRSGYTSSSQTITKGGDHTLTFRLQPTPTVTVRLTNGTTVQFDREELKFGYVILFVGFAGFEYEDFCLGDGTAVRYNTADMKRVIGPATLATPATNCCSRQLEKVRLELRNGQTSDVYFKDSCFDYTVDLAARNHTTGAYTFVKFSEIAEVIFP